MKTKKKILVSLGLVLIFLGLKANLFAQNCTVNAGVDKTICAGNVIQLDGGAAAPYQSNTILWSIVSQPAGANVTIANTNSLVTNAGVANIPGNYTFRLSTTCGDGVFTSDNVVITVNPAPAVPVQTGTSSYNCISSGASTGTLTGTAPATGETAYWSIVQGNGTFSTPGSSSTTFTPYFNPDECSNSTVVVLRYTLSNGSCSRYVDRTYTFTRNYGSPTVTYSGGCSQSFVVLRGSCPGTGTVSWSTVSSPAGSPTPVFSPVNTQFTTASKLVAGTYVFRYTITGGCNAGSADVTVVIQNGDPVIPPSAGADRQLCSIPSIISLSGSVPPIGQTVTWSQLSGGTSVVFANPNSANTTASGLTDAGAPYTFVYQISNGSCSSYDTISIYKIPQMSFGNTSMTSCSSAATGVPVGNFWYGSYLFNTIDTIRFSSTFLSGPAGTSVTMTLNATNNYGANIPTALAGISVGQTRVITLGAGSIYPNPQNQSTLYNLGVSFTNITIPGIYRFKISYTTKCGTDETEITIVRGVGNTVVNAGTDAVLNCGANTVTLSGSMPDNYGIWSTVQMPTGATNPINVSNQTLRYPPLAGLIPGTYTFKLMPNPGPSCTPATVDYVNVYVSNTLPPVPDAGVDKSSCAGTIRLSGSAIPAGVNATWSIVSPTQTTETFSDINAANPLVNNLKPNTTYTFRYTFINGCGSQSDEVTITTGSTIAPSKPSITVGAFIDCATSTTTIPSVGTMNYTISISPSTPVGATGTFTLLATPSGPSMAITSQSASTANLAISNITQPTTFTVIYSVTNTNCPGEAVADTVTFQLIGNNAATISAGASQQFCSVSSYPLTTTLSGTSASGINTLWSTVYSSTTSQPVIADPTSGNTTVSLSADGTYRFKYEYVSPNVSCPNLGYATTQIITSSASSVAQAGPDISFCNSNGTTALQATPLVTGTGYWSINRIMSGIAPSISTPSSATSNIVFTQSGSVELKWISYNPSSPECGPSSEDLVTVTYYKPANAGIDQNICSATSTNLNALSALPASGVWSQVSGPNTASIVDITNNQTAVTNLIPGTYVFRWTINAGSCSTQDDVQVNITSLGTTANAGEDYSFCNSSTNDKIVLNATAASVGLTGTWALISLPFGATNGSFSNIHDPKAIYSGANVAGQYVFSWTLTNGNCSSTDFVTVTVDPTACITISGTVFNDANGNTVINVGESGTTAGTNLYVYLVSSSGIVVDSVKVNPDGTYLLNASSNTTYTIELSTIQYPVGTNVNTTPIVNTPPTGWVTTGENGAGNTGTGDGTPNGVLAVTTVTTNVTQQNFGIEQPPVANDVTVASQINPGGSVQVTVPALNGTDAEDGVLSTGDIVTITSLPTTGTLYYNGIAVIVGQTIVNYDPTKLTVDPNDGNVTVVFTYTVTDAAGIASAPATVTMPFTNNVPVANPDFSTTYVNIPVTVPVLKNDTFGADGPSVGSITITDNANYGNAVVNNGGTPNDPTDDKIVYTPNVGYAGNDTLIYRICDINGDCDTAIVIIAISVGAPLPVALQSFDAQQTTENIVDVTWRVGQELGIKLYEVQKSTDGLDFQTVGKVNATGSSSYAYRDMASNIGDAYYRLKIVELSGKESFSPIRKLGYTSSGMIGIYPNPASIYVNVTLPKEWRNKKIVMMLYNQAGQEMLRKVVQYSQATERIDLSVKIPAGIYHLKLQNNKTVAERKVIVVR